MSTDPTPTSRAAEDIAVGTPVLAWPGTRHEHPLVTRTRSAVWTVGMGHEIVKVEGYAGGISLDHVDVLPAGLLREQEPAQGGLTEADLARTIWEASRADEGTISATGADIVARAVLDLLAARRPGHRLHRPGG